MRSKIGTVVSKKMNKTLVLRVDSSHAHPKYKKQVRTSSRLYAHNPENGYELGDKVEVYETRPLSKLKRWTVIKPPTV